MVENKPQKILLIDDNQAIHDDFRKTILNKNILSEAFEDSVNQLFNRDRIVIEENPMPEIILDSAFQGEEALHLVKQALDLGQPYALAFVDIRMPPGWDGVKTIKKIWEVDQDIQIVICSAHSDYSLTEISEILNGKDNLIILKKPFEVIEVQQLVLALIKKWELKQQVKHHIQNLEQLVNARTAALELANSELDKSLTLTRATIESTHEGILVLGQKETVLMYNEKFLSLWNIPYPLIQNVRTSELLKFLASRVENSDEFLTMIASLRKHSKNERLTEFQLQTGQVFELYSNFYQNLNENLQGVVLSFRDITEKKRLEEELLHLATHDALTGLPNRLILKDRLQQALRYAKRNNLHLGVLMLDIDHFKQINDSLGHTAGDELLIQMARRIKGCFRETDTVTRFGGDEFVMVSTTQKDADGLSTVAEELKDIINTPFHINKQRIRVTGSIGISIYPLDGTWAEELIKNADSALYYAKELGRNNFQFYTSELNNNLLASVALEKEIEQGIKNEQFTLFYQSLLSLKTNKVIGVEAIIQWIHPTLGTIPPNRFIPIAERTGLIIPLGNWVLRTAFLQVKKWHKINPELIVSITVCGTQIVQRDFLKEMKQAIKDSQISPQTIELEITENVILKNSTKVSSTMKALKDMGVRLSMDEFGIGYSSINYVKFFPFDKIKIDKSFIQGIEDNIDDRNIVKAIITMTQSMGIQIVAEGVETKDQLEFLRKNHSNQIQAYLYNSPLKGSDFSNFLKKQKNK